MTHESTAILDWHINTAAAKLGYRTNDIFALLGYIPTFVFESDPRPAWEQFNERYVFGGWNPMLPGGWQMDQDNNLLYPGDPPLIPLASTMLRDEQIVVYAHSFVAIIQRDGSFSVARMD